MVIMNFVKLENRKLTSQDYEEIQYLRRSQFRSSSNLIHRLPFTTSLVVRSTYFLVDFFTLFLPKNSKRRKIVGQIIVFFPFTLRKVIFEAVISRGVLTKRTDGKQTSYHHETSYSIDLGFGILTSNRPRVSIILPVHNNWWFTYNCLRAIQRSLDSTPFELIIIDDFSDDLTEHALSNVRGVQVIRNQKNYGYLLSTNLGAKFAKGEFLLLLNNDTEPVSGWLDELVQTADSDSRFAIVGSTLIFPNGQVQESGAQIFNNGNAWNLGRYQSPSNGQFRFTKQVDYCSAASILVRRNFWEAVGGFDDSFAPAYCEDSDLAMHAWNLGFVVIHCPTSWVIHHEGISHEKSNFIGLRKFQKDNNSKFFKKWNSDLKFHWPDSGVPRLEHSRDSKGIIVLCDRDAPSSLRDAGSLRTLQIISHLKEIGFHVIFSATNFSTREIDLVKLEKSGVEIHRTKTELLESLKTRTSRIKLYWLVRPEVSSYFRSELLQLKSAPVLVDMQDIRYEKSRFDTKIDREFLEQALTADMTVLCSQVETNQLASLYPELNLQTLWAEYNADPRKVNWADRSGLVFVGGFRHKPNIEGLNFFIDEVLPILRLSNFQEEIRVVGSGLEKTYVEKLKSLGINYLGVVQNIDEIYFASKIAIAPLISGGGRKGKIGEALSYGLPIVTTLIGAEGFFFSENGPARVTDDPKQFAEEIIKLVNEEILWESSSQRAYDYCNQYLTSKEFHAQIRNILKTLLDSDLTLSFDS